MNDPYRVIEDFFDMHSLITIRGNLKQWLDDVVYDIDADAADHLSTYEQVEKLVEAAWVIEEQWRLSKKEVENEDWEEETENLVPEPTYEDDQLPRFVKRRVLVFSPKTNPLQSIKEVFRNIDLPYLIETFEQWIKIALTVEDGNYEHANERADLVDFCEGLYTLLEISYVLFRKAEWNVEGRVKRPLRESLQYDLLQEEQTFRLAERRNCQASKSACCFFWPL